MAEKENKEKVSVTEEAEQSQKVTTKYDRKIKRREEEQRKLAKEKKIWQTVGIVLLAALIVWLISIPVRKVIATKATYITVGGEKITKAEFDYYYKTASNQYISSYGMYLSYMGLDTSKDFSKQSYSENMTWADYFSQMATDSIKQTKALKAEAEKAGFTYDSSKDYEDFKENMKSAANEAGVTLSKHYKLTFGNYASAKSIKPYMEEGALAAAYYQSVSKEKRPSDEEIQKYYDENTDNYDSVDYLLTEVEAEIPQATETKEEEGTETATKEENETATESTEEEEETTKESTKEPTEEEIKEAMEKAKATADAAVDKLDQDGSKHTNEQKSAISSMYSEWLFDGERKPNDTTVIEDENNNKYYVLKFQKRYLDEVDTANVRMILTENKKGTEIVEEWKAQSETEEAFIAMVEKYSEDSSTRADGGLYEEISPSGLQEDLKNWIFDEERKSGDVTTLTVNETDYVIYYQGVGRKGWQVSIQNTLLNETMSNWLTELKDAVSVEDPGKHLRYLLEESKAESTAVSGSEGETTDESGESESVSTSESAGGSKSGE